ncbi:MAG: hypothetical protein WA902_18910 [Thermosynechococcaceae cyanobacterium]
MPNSLNIQELAFVVAVRQQDPTLINPEFLHYSGIIPEAWELAQQPVRSAQAAQIRFKNGVAVMAYPQRTVFIEPFRQDSEEQLVPGIVQRYTEILRNLELQAFGFNLQGFVPFNQSADAARNYLNEKLLANGPWQHIIGTAPVQAQLNFSYQFDRNRLSLSVQEAALQLPEQQRVPIVMFAGNFENDLRSISAPERLGHLHQLLQSWPQDLAAYQSVVDQFLGTASAETSSELQVINAAPMEPVLESV